MSRFESYGPLIIRMMLGIGFIVFHGWGKMLSMWSYLVHGESWFLVELVSFMPILPNFLWAMAAGIGEFFGGLSVLLGVKTRWGAAILAFIMVVAMLGVKIPAGKSFELDMAYFAMAISLILTGPGPYTLLLKKGP